MAKRHMLQLRMDQVFAGSVTNVPAVDDFAAMFLDPTLKTVVRELSAEELGGVDLVIADGWGTVTNLEGISSVFVQIDLHPVRGEGVLTLYGPSCVDSPEIDTRGGAILRVYTTGYSVVSGSAKLHASRAIAAHAYLDQV